jgi:DNA-binding LacI/PurR family transcriptional regulator
LASEQGIKGRALRGEADGEPAGPEADTLETMRQMVRRIPGQRLPGERELAIQLNVSRQRLRSVLATLRQEGLVEPRAKSGTYALDLEAKRFRRIVVLIDARLKLGDDPFFSLLVDALQRNIQAAGAQCQMVRTDGQGERPPLEDGALTLGLAGSALLAGQRVSDPPMVGLLLDAEARPTRCASVFQLADREAGQTAAEALLERGCRYLIFLGRRDIPASRERLAGVEEAIHRAGGRLEFISCHLNYADGLRLGREMELPADPDAVGIVATNDWLAVGLRAGLRHRATSALRHLPIVSFDGLPLTTESSLEIRSLAVPIDAIARDAIAELQHLMQAPGTLGRTIRYPLMWAHNP